MKSTKPSHSFDDNNTVLVKDHISHEETFVEVFEYATHKLHDPWYKSLLFGLMAGFFVALAYIIVILALSGFITRNDNGIVAVAPNIPQGLVVIITGLTFTPAILMVIFIGGALFTSNSLTLLPVIKRQAKLRTMALNLSLVLLGNLFGALLVAVMTYLMGLMNRNSFIDVFEYIYTKKLPSTNFSWTVLLNNFVSGIFCNLLIAGLFWMSMAVKNSSSKILLCFFVILAFGISGFQHIVANAYVWTTGLFLKSDQIGTNFSMFALLNMLPTLLGNFVGGGLILPLVYLLVFNKRIDREIKTNRFLKQR